MLAIKRILALALAATLFQAPNASGQQPSSDIRPGTTESQEANIRAYVELLRVDVRAKKTAIFTEIMQFNDQQAGKFWPIYTEYDIELQKLNDRKLAGIQEYAKNFGNMTDQKADALIHKALACQKQREELLATTYEKVKQALGAITAARFAQVEDQLLLIIDLQIASGSQLARKSPMRCKLVQHMVKESYSGMNLIGTCSGTNMGARTCFGTRASPSAAPCRPRVLANSRPRRSAGDPAGAHRRPSRPRRAVCRERD